MAKKQNPAIAIAIISAVGLVAAYFLGSPLANTLYEDRPIVDVSFGNRADLPKNQLQIDGQNYYVDISVINRGKTDGKISLDVVGTNATVSFHRNGPFEANSILMVSSYPNSTSTQIKVYVLPSVNTNTFSVNMMPEHQSDKQIFQVLNKFTPLNLTYQKSQNDYVLIDAR